MTKGQQVNVRVSEATRQQLEALRKPHGSVSEAVAVAVDRLARDYSTGAVDMTVGIGARFKVLERDRFTCQYCGRKVPDVMLHVDHLLPVLQGGTDDLSNLITSCHECNLGKGNRVLGDGVIVPGPESQLDGAGTGEQPNRSPKHYGEKLARATIILTDTDMARLDRIPGSTRSDRIIYLLNKCGGER